MPDTTTGVSDPGAQPRPAPDERGGGGRRPGSRALRLVGVVAAVALVAGLIGVGVFWAKARGADERRQERAAAASAASQFALRMDAIDGADFDGYIKRINQMLTTKARTKNSQVFDQIRQGYEAAKVTGQGKVLLTGVGDFDADSANVLVVHDASVKTTQGNVEHHYRWSVSMVKVRDRWLVDDFDPVN